MFPGWEHDKGRSIRKFKVARGPAAAEAAIRNRHGHPTFTAARAGMRAGAAIKAAVKQSDRRTVCCAEPRPGVFFH